MVDEEMAYNERQKTLRPLTIHEVADRWYSYEKVVQAIGNGRLRPRHDGTFDWLHVISVDIGIAAMLRRPHPDIAAEHDESQWLRNEAAYTQRLVEHRRQKLAESFSLLEEPPPPEGQTNIYFIEAIGSGACKIGKADNIANRFQNLRNMSGAPLRLLAFMHGEPKVERDLHRRFKEERSHGEWFELSVRLQRFINKARREYGLPKWAVIG